MLLIWTVLCGFLICAVAFQALVTYKTAGTTFLTEAEKAADQPVQATVAKKTTKKILLVATGDIIPARSVNTRAIKHGDPAWAFRKIAPLLASGDITLINMESSLLENCPQTDYGFVFCGQASAMEGLVLSGVDVVNVANNHFANYGQEGIDETLKRFEKENMVASGLYNAQPIYKDVKGVRFAFLGYNDIGNELGLSPADTTLMSKEISEANKSADVVVVSMHWGIEYVALPNERQQALAHTAIDNGADLIIGNHPHWVQSDEYYKGKYIKYAHGNTIFDQMWSEETKKGVIGKYFFDGPNFVNVEFVKTYIKDYGQPEIVLE